LVKSRTPRINKIEYFFSKKVGEALYAYRMIEENDKIIVAVSGGKDSLSLLKVLCYKQGRLPVKYDIVACYVDMGLDNEAPKVLERYFSEYGYNYTIESARIWESKKEKDDRINCFWCSFNRRKTLFETAERLGCNKIALGHHKDDIAETFLLNLFFHGEISTMLPNQPIFKGKLRIIRPLCLCEESAISRYAEASGFPQLHTKCPNSATTKRMLMKNILRLVSEHNKDAKTNIFRSMKKINYDYLIR
jgi:tRNA 2-thiocytidine biosynthesis protein TtcA